MAMKVVFFLLILLIIVINFSRYHYYGICVKEDSPYHDTVYNSTRQSSSGFSQSYSRAEVEAGSQVNTSEFNWFVKHGLTWENRQQQSLQLSTKYNETPKKIHKIMIYLPPFPLNNIANPEIQTSGNLSFSQKIGGKGFHKLFYPIFQGISLILSTIVASKSPSEKLLFYWSSFHEFSCRLLLREDMVKLLKSEA